MHAMYFILLKPILNSNKNMQEDFYNLAYTLMGHLAQFLLKPLQDVV